MSAVRSGAEEVFCPVEHLERIGESAELAERKGTVEEGPANERDAEVRIDELRQAVREPRRDGMDGDGARRLVIERTMSGEDELPHQCLGNGMLREALQPFALGFLEHLGDTGGGRSHLRTELLGLTGDLFA